MSASAQKKFSELRIERDKLARAAEVRDAALADAERAALAVCDLLGAPFPAVARSDSPAFQLGRARAMALFAATAHQRAAAIAAIAARSNGKSDATCSAALFSGSFCESLESLPSLPSLQ